MGVILGDIVSSLLNTVLQNILGYFKEQQAERDKWTAASRTMQLQGEFGVSEIQNILNNQKTVVINTPKELLACLS